MLVFPNIPSTFLRIGVNVASLVNSSIPNVDTIAITYDTAGSKHLFCLSLHKVQARDDICLFHNLNLQFYYLQFTIYLPFNHLVIYIA